MAYEITFMYTGKRAIVVGGKEAKPFVNRLQGFGFDVVLFREGEEVLRSLATRAPDLLVGVGLGLPDMGTLELLNRAIALNVNTEMRTVWLFDGVYQDDSRVTWREQGINL